jgi:hypothetical protein
LIAVWWEYSKIWAAFWFNTLNPLTWFFFQFLQYKWSRVCLGGNRQLSRLHHGLHIFRKPNVLWHWQTYPTLGAAKSCISLFFFSILQLDSWYDTREEAKRSECQKYAQVTDSHHWHRHCPVVCRNSPSGGYSKL